MAAFVSSNEEQGEEKEGVDLCSNEGNEKEETLAHLFPFQDEDVDLEREKRQSCARCMRPQMVCLCGYLPKTPINIRSTVHIMQHPREESRLLTTVPILQACLHAERVKVYQGVKFLETRFPKLHEDLQTGTSVLLYPGEKAIDIDLFVTSHEKKINACADGTHFNEKKINACTDGTHFNLVVLDGTWREARRLYFHNSFLHTLPQIKLKETHLSEFIIRTQPTNESVSTLEAVAFALAVLEDKPDLSQILISPLKALCQIQLEHGAVIHQSKEEKAKIKNNEC